MGTEKENIVHSFISWCRSNYRLVAGASFLLILVLALSIYFLLRPKYEPLFTDLKAADARTIIAELEKEKIPYRLDEEAGRILVPDNSSRATRIKLMSGDLRLQDVVGLELFKDSSLGLTEFAQKVNYQRALQGELSRTIMSLDEVDVARVHLTLPESSIFRRDRPRPKGSIAVFMRRDQQLSEETIEGIQRLVAAAIPEMQPSDVTVLDSSGAAMASSKRETEDKRLALKQATESHYQDKIEAQVVHLIGSSPVNIAVDVDINFDQVQVTRHSESRPRTFSAPSLASLPSIREADEKDVVSIERPPLPTLQSERKNNRVVEQVVSAPGSIRRLSVGIALERELSPDDARRLTELVSASNGLDPSRGDRISIVARVPTAPANAASESSALPSLLTATDTATTNPDPPSDSHALSEAAATTSAGASAHPRFAHLQEHAWLAIPCLLMLALIAIFLTRKSARNALPSMSEAERQAFVQRLKKLIRDEEHHGEA